MTGEEAEIIEGIQEEIESTRRVERANSSTVQAQATGVDRRAEMPRSARISHTPTRNAGRSDSPAATRSAGARRSSDTIRTPPSTRSTPLARTTHRTGNAPPRHQRRRRR